MSALHRLRAAPWRRWLLGGFVGAATFAVGGTVTAVWPNPLFSRMTPVGRWEWILLALEAVTLGLFVAVRRAACPTGAATTGGVLAFLGVACPVCNKLLVLVFGASFLLAYFEPIRLPLGLIGLAISLAVLARELAAARLLRRPLPTPPTP